MIPRHTYLLTGLVFYSILVLGLLPSVAEKPSRSQRELTLAIAQNDYPLFFANPQISLELKTTIARDLQKLEFAFEQELVFDKYSHPRYDVVTHRFDNTSQERSWVHSVPEVIHKHFKFALEQEGEYHLFVPKKIIKAYDNVLGIKKEHPEMFKQREDFLRLLENQEKVRQIAQLPDKAKAMIYRHNLSFDNAIRDLQNYPKVDVKYLSLLDIRPLNEYIHNDKAPEGSFVMIPAVSIESRAGGRNVDLSQVIVRFPFGAYVNNEWRIFVHRGP